jgi:hypothetical protein
METPLQKKEPSQPADEDSGEIVLKKSDTKKKEAKKKPSNKADLRSMKIKKLAKQDSSSDEDTEKSQERETKVITVNGKEYLLYERIISDSEASLFFNN